MCLDWRTEKALLDRALGGFKSRRRLFGSTGQRVSEWVVD